MAILDFHLKSNEKQQITHCRNNSMRKTTNTTLSEQLHEKNKYHTVGTTP